MEDFDYKGYIIHETPEGTYQIGDIEFPSMTEAMRWVDSMEEGGDSDRDIPTTERKLHTYQFFYVDRTTDRSFEARVKAYNFEEAKDILRKEYDVYTIADYDILD